MLYRIVKEIREFSIELYKFSFYILFYISRYINDQRVMQALGVILGINLQTAGEY